jgi:hypothetical protein
MEESSCRPALNRRFVERELKYECLSVTKKGQGLRHDEATGGQVDRSELKLTE